MEFNLIYKNLRLGEIKHTLDLIKSKIYQPVTTMKIRYAKTKEPVPFSRKNQLVYEPISKGTSWGELFDCAWFECSGEIPKQYLDINLFVVFDISGEALLYDESGQPVKGFTNGSSVFDRQYGEPGKRTYQINSFIREDGSFTLFFDGACNDLFGNYQDNGKIIMAEIALKDEIMESLFYDLETCIDLLLVYPEDSKEYKSLFETLHDVYQLVEYEEADMIKAVSKKIAPYLNSSETKKETINALGHAHLDLAWLWPIRETKRKLLRTLTNVFYLFEKYPEFTFGFSQPQLLEWLEEEAPELYEKVKYYHQLGRFELQGGAWVEMDTNLVGEEAMIRQFLYGINYYREKFNFEPKSLWLPDVFGYSGNLPQIIKKCGLDYFMTIKMSWSLINQFPHHTFNFEGVDGSTVLAHMPPEGTYNSSAKAHVCKEAQSKYKEKEISSDTLLLFGIGDGGGGPGDEHMQRLRRNQNVAGLPAIEIISSEAFFEKLAKKRDTYPTYKGELYLENHQGTFTSQSNIKKWNRHLEQKLKAVEYLLAYNDRQDLKVHLDRIWKEVLLYQFHDILPGSSIKRVYDETLARYKELDNEIDELLKSNGYSLNSNLLEANYLFNPLPFEITKYIMADDLIRKVTIEGLSTNKIEDSEEMLEKINFRNKITTELYTLEINDNGEIISFVDNKTNKELVNKRNCNALRVYKDIGDAWNINYRYRAQTPKKLTKESIVLLEGKDFFEYRMRYSFKESTVLQNVRIFKNKRYVEFYHEVDWQNVGWMLRSQFDVGIEAETAISDIQFGFIGRSRKETTDQEKAMLEVPSQQWISIDDGKVGSAILNTSKYGYYIKDGLLDINLLRSTNYPCENGDIGTTNYTYAWFIHDACLNEVDIMAKKLNSSVLGFDNNEVRNRLFNWDNNKIHLSILKPAYNSEGQILRLYNNANTNQDTVLFFLRHFYNVIETNMIEDNKENLGEIETLSLSFKPFEVKTFRVIKTKSRGYYPYHIPRAKTIYFYKKPMNHEEAILLSSLQGVLAKQKSQLYLAGNHAYLDWLETIVKPQHDCLEVNTIKEAMQIFSDSIKGYVIYQAKKESQNIAATIAGVEGYILIEESQLELVEGLKLEYIDAREIDYAFMLETYKEDLNFDIIIQQAPIYCGLYDLGIALRGVYTSNVKTEIIDLGIELKKDTPILGWVPDDEVIGVTYLSEIDCNMIASNHSLNMTYFLQNKEMFWAKNLSKQEAVEENKHYVTFVLSDGDNVQWMMGDYYQSERTYGHPKRGSIPFGWSLSPSMVDLAPEILQQYYIHKKENDVFTSGVSGAGYMYPDQYSKEALEAFLDRTEFYYQKLDINYLAILGTRLFDEDKTCLEAYAKRNSIKGAFLYANFDYYKGYNGDLWWYNDKPFISARYALWDQPDLAVFAKMISQGKVDKTSKDGYSMIVVHTWSHTYQDVLDVIAMLDDSIQVLNPKTFMEQLTKYCKR